MMNYRLLIAVGLVLLMSLCRDMANAQNIVENKYDIKADTALVLPEGMNHVVMDSLLRDWKTRNYILIDTEDCQSSAMNPVFEDKVYIERLSRLPNLIEMPYNAVVRQYIDLYTSRLRPNVSYMLGVANFYFPIFEEALDAYGLPLELKYLPIIESGLNPSAVSRAGAAGLWQFMLTTGRIYGLECNSLVDERRDPIKSTWAAARYLKELYDIYHNWTLVIAAYNCGPGTVNKAIKRNNGKTDYWDLYYSLPKETRGYVPSFIAVNYVMNYYCEHNICPMVADVSLDTDTVHISRQLHFKQISDVCNVPVDKIASLNPQYKSSVIPGKSMVCSLRLPQEDLYNFIINEDSVYRYKENELFKNRKVVDIKQSSASSSSSTKYYKIRRGDSLSTIARKFGTTVSRLKSLNGLKNDRISAGKTIRVR